MPKARPFVRVTVNLSPELVEQIDTYAETMGVNRTSAVSVLLSQSLNSQKAVHDISEFLELVKAEKAKIGG